MRIIRFSAKCSDLFGALLIENDNAVGHYDGYVPDFFPGDHYGDYVQMDVDIDTGRIMNWKKPTKADLKIFH